jgi:hypothetical protein
MLIAKSMEKLNNELQSDLNLQKFKSIQFVEVMSC